MFPCIDKEDLEHIFKHTSDLWEEMRGQNIFITGGTGFFGCWLLESLIWANEKLQLGTNAFVLTRNPESFSRKVPHIVNNKSIHLITGDVCTFKFPAGNYPFIIHAATEASDKLNKENPLFMFDTIVEGTRHVLNFAISRGTKKILLTSSGAVYGKQPSEMTHISEEYRGAPDPLDINSAYGEGKRAAELLCCLYANKYGLETKIARCFAFIGPYLPMDSHFAIGNFIRDALANKSIYIKGDGTPYRSYLYAADLTIWLWEILLRGQSCRSYNVGSENNITILELAKVIKNIANSDIDISIAGNQNINEPRQQYVPSTKRARLELSLKTLVPLEKAIEKTIKWVQHD